MHKSKFDHNKLCISAHDIDDLKRQYRLAKLENENGRAAKSLRKLMIKRLDDLGTIVASLKEAYEND